MARDATVTVAIYVGEPPQLLDGCVVEEVAWSWASTADNGVVTVADAGGGTLTLYDPARRFDPANDQATDPLTKIGTRVQVVVAGAPAFTGRVDDVGHDLTTAKVALVDEVAALATIQFVETSVPSESAAARIGRILDLAAWPAARRDIHAGGVTLQAGTVAADAWSELVEVNRNELGALWITPAGNVAWRPRSEAWAYGQAVQLTVGCPPSDVPLVALATRGDQSDLVNVLVASRRSGTARTVTDTASLATYGRHSHNQLDLELSTDVFRDAWQDFYLRRQAAPVRGVGGFASRPGAAAIAKALALPFGALVQVKDEGHGPPIDRPARLVGARWKIDPGLVEWVAVTGEDASIKPVARTLRIDTPAEWTAYGRPTWAGLGVVNGSFESDFSGWYSTPAGIGVSTPVDSAAPHGSKVLRLTGPGNVPYASPGDVTPVQPGTIVRLRGWAKRESGTAGANISMHAYTAAGVATYHVVNLVMDAAGGYKEGHYQVPLDGSVASLRASAWINSAAAVAGDVWRFDDISLVAGNASYQEPGVVPLTWPAA
jgi:hypothetical protein